MTAVRRTTVTAPVAALAAVTAAAWVALTRLDMMAANAAAFLLAWTVMMVAMMLPSAAPLVLVYGRRGRTQLVLGYLAVWAAIGMTVYALAQAVDLMDMPRAAIAAVLVAAGVYQFTPAKDVCLRACRSPLDFVAARWGQGAFRLGVEHGLYCVGCCWALMAILVVAAAMSIWVAAALTAVVFAEKVLPLGEWAARATGIAILGAAIGVLV